MRISEIIESHNSTAVIIYGRMNPPTLGHQKLVDQLLSVSSKTGGESIIFLSHSQDNKTNPLSFEQKKTYANKFFPNVIIAPGSASKTFISALQYLQDTGVTDVIQLVGSDRHTGFQKIIDSYNGKPDKSGNIPFKFKNYEFVKLDRDPDSDGVDGLSASKVREFVSKNDYESFSKAVPGDNKTKQDLYNDLRATLSK
jgi:hypothetical protein